MAVEVEPSPARSGSAVAWELVTARGDVLRVYQGTSCSDLVAVKHALKSGEEGR